MKHLAWDCHGSLGGCHPHLHTYIHPGHGASFAHHGGAGLGVLMFILLAVIIGHRLTDGEWG